MCRNKTAGLTSPTAKTTFVPACAPDQTDIFESLDQLKDASSALLPPFKTVSVGGPADMPESPEKQATNTTLYTQSQTILVTSDIISGNKERTTGKIKELVSQKDGDIVVEQVASKNGQGAEMVADERPAADLAGGEPTGVFERRFVGDQPTQFLSFEICKVEPRVIPPTWSPAKESSHH